MELPAVSVWTSTLEIFVAKNNALNMTPTMTPRARLLVNRTMMTVRIMTNASVLGAFIVYLNEPQSNVPMETMTMMPARIGIGICTTQSPRTIIRNIRNAPAVNVDRRVVAPDLTLITDCPIIAHPPMPPKKPVMKLAMPCPRDSLFLLLNESVALSTILAVSRLSTSPTTAMDSEKGRMIRSV